MSAQTSNAPVNNDQAPIDNQETLDNKESIHPTPAKNSENDQNVSTDPPASASPKVESNPSDPDGGVMDPAAAPAESNDTEPLDETSSPEAPEPEVIPDSKDEQDNLNQDTASAPTSTTDQPATIQIDQTQSKEAGPEQTQDLKPEEPSTSSLVCTKRAATMEAALNGEPPILKKQKSMCA